ncbi:GNAT family N-acetyltransferase [Pseudovibrio exalbescens]|uniref:GNAT family N-acetyltransferase n=1 Tax=Pseudovibrio exalbescens TaxID=197461 RepID=UPI002366AEAC|nr:GNAT family N-acetyltransferase [Pseudovibrio exalbescens]MDD7909790.1 GNAT family N-acetyltransferase [Pseudovibrio exalbescens]
MGSQTQIARGEVELPERKEKDRSKNLSLAVLDSPDGMERSKHQWHALEERCAPHSVFTSWPLCFAALQNLSDHERGCIFTVWDGEKLVAVLPLKRVARRGLAKLTNLISEGHSTLDLMADEAVSRSDLLAVLAPAFKAAKADLLELRELKMNQALMQFLEWAGHAHKFKGTTAQLDLQSSSSFEDYFVDIGEELRQRMHTGRRQLEKVAPIEHKIITDHQQLIEQTMPEFGPLASMDEARVRKLSFIRALASAPSEACRVVLTVIKHGDRMISREWGVIHRKGYTAYAICRDPAYDKFHTHALHNAENIRMCFENKLKSMDFGAHLKTEAIAWTNNLTPVFDVYRALTPKGYLYLYGWRAALKPALKWLVRKGRKLLAVGFRKLPRRASSSSAS